MNQAQHRFCANGVFALIAALIVLVVAGCATRPPAPASSNEPGLLRPRDTIIATFLGNGGIQELLFTVNEDGTITLHPNQTFIAAGKTPLELQKEIQTRNLERSLANLTVIVSTDVEYYTVTGVRYPGRYRWSESLTVTRALAIANGGGDFTDFGSRRVILIRANGKRMNVDLIKAMQDPSQDPKVLPGDTISIPRRGPFG